MVGLKSDEYYEIIGRINELENIVNNLKLENRDNIGEVNDDMEDIKESKISKNEAISQVKQILDPILKSKDFFVRKAILKNGEGSGILLESNDKLKNKKIMLKKSKDYAKQYNFDDMFKFSGWFTASDSELNEYDGYIFVVYKNSIPTYFVFNRSEMKQVLEHKKKDSAGKYHFYLAEDDQGLYFDHRDGGLHLTGNVDAWHFIEEVVSEE